MTTHQYQTILSPARLKTYRVGSESDGEALAKYFWNLHLSGSLLPIVALTEIVLRNRIVNAFDQKASDWLTLDWPGWSDYKQRPILENGKHRTLFGNPEREMLQKGLSRWKDRRDSMIADLPLGFWTSMFKGHYKLHIWAKKGTINAVFPGLTIKHADIVSEVARRLHSFRNLRNRICHHEPIFNWPGKASPGSENLASAHADTLSLLKWLSTEGYHDIQIHDSFPGIWKASWQKYLEEL